MAEYIDREDAIRKIRDIYCKGCKNYNGVRCRACNFADAIDILEDVQKSDVAEVRHAKWDDSGRYEFPGGSKAIVCTGCGCALTAGEYRMNKWNFCPVCGADMRGADDA